MSSLADLFTPTFFMFLGILLLIVSILVIYFESRMRDQNHKIASMLSLVSTLAEDMNGVKMGLSHLAIHGSSGPISSFTPHMGGSNDNKLITVSDGEYDDDDEEQDQDEDHDDLEEDDLDQDDLEEDDLEGEDLEQDDLEGEEEFEDDLEELATEEDDDSHSEMSNEDIKVLKLNLSHNLETNDNDVEDINELDQLDELDDILENQVTTELETEQNASIFTPSDLKTITINLGEDTSNLEEVEVEEVESQHKSESDELQDYKNLSLNKLRTIVSEKGLAKNPFKLKKPELLKLLEA